MRTRSARLGWSTLLLAALACDGSSPTTLEPADGMEAGRGGIPKPLGRIAVVLDAQPNDGRDFGFTLTGQKRAAALDDDADPTLFNTRVWPSLAAGSYTLAFPTPLPLGYRLIGISCASIGSSTSGSPTSFSPNVAAANAVISLGEGGDVRCTFVVSVNTTPLTVTINQAGFQDDPTQNPEVYFEVVFSHTPVDFNVNDVAVSGLGSVWSVWPLDNEATRFQVQVGVDGDGYVSASIPAAAVIDGWGKPNEASTSTDNGVEVYQGDMTECVDDNPDDGEFCTSS